MNRCDACYFAEAFHVVRNGDQELHFCDHHWNEHETALIGWAETLDNSPVMV
jgi:hypothetical protein